ncbi:peptide ABC transporter substrate-binding protein [Aliiroseovarius sp. F20344]|uniref:peptide ABC transporter substrate-binding protein n=1 Tax=Aliiroseovarius sp. F20344 TaxID=2926414 RepID=UPI001FF0F8C3|nr:peptide ABC transporter substrate-binding protein [Aliiroseovarius sp. F20344]MCK0142414.1 peptide ABC transporter substrate-binding protein [Aliiroseovarius sp. F20344]
MSVNLRPVGYLTLSICALSSAAMADRGDQGKLSLLYWQAPTLLNPYLASAPKDSEPASLVLEPLARYDENGIMLPWLAEAIPTLENGGIDPDMGSITWTLKQGIKWSDGSDFTAEDVVFTADYCMSADSGCQMTAKFTDVSQVEALDAHTVRISFAKPKPYPYGPFVGLEVPVLQANQFADCIGPDAVNCSAENLSPIGTGPYRITEFKPGDVVSYDINPYYRDATKPGFASVVVKGGGDALGAARAVLETGEFDYAWNLQLDPEVLTKMKAANKGQVVSSFGTAVERLQVNLTNPATDLYDARSTRDGGAHPFLADPRVTKALSLAIDRTALVQIAYGEAGRPTCDVLAAPAIYTSGANDDCLTQDLDRARALLDEAGWTDSDGDGIRDKDGHSMALLYQTSVNPVRQTTQDLLKAWWTEIGVETELRAIAPAVFFGGDQSSPDTFQKFYADLEMFTNFFPGSDPEPYLNNWTCAAIPTPENGWAGMNVPRYCDADYDALIAKLGNTVDLEQRIDISKELNNMLMQAGALIPLVHRGEVSAHATSLQGVRMNVWDSELWNIADWTRAK